MGLDPDQLAKAAEAFLKSGFNRPTMTELAVACGFSRRALYYHYRNKEELFRDVVRYQNERAMYAGWTAGMSVLMEGGDAIDVITALLDIGSARRAALLPTRPTLLNWRIRSFAFATILSSTCRYACRKTWSKCSKCCTRPAN